MLDLIRDSDKMVSVGLITPREEAMERSTSVFGWDVFAAPYQGAKDALDLAAEYVGTSAMKEGTPADYGEMLELSAMTGVAMPIEIGQGQTDEKVKAFLLDELDRSRQSIRDARVSRQDMSMAGQFVRQATTVVGAAVAGTVATGNPMVGAAAGGAVAGRQTYHDLAAQGVDEDVATLGGVVSSVLMTVGARLAPYYGEKLASQMVSGMAINVGLGGLERGTIGKTLRGAGYDDVAKQYDVLDSHAIMADAVLSIALVAGGRFMGLRAGNRVFNQSEVDAALVTREATSEAANAPVIPKNQNDLNVIAEEQARIHDELFANGKSVFDIKPPDIDGLPNPKHAADVEFARNEIEDYGFKPLDISVDDFYNPAREASNVTGKELSYMEKSARDYLESAPDTVVEFNGKTMKATEALDEADVQLKDAATDIDLMNIAVACHLGK